MIIADTCRYRRPTKRDGINARGRSLSDPPRRRTAAFFFHDTATTVIYTLSLHDALPISIVGTDLRLVERVLGRLTIARAALAGRSRSEEHTSELQSRENLVCRLLLEKKKKPQRPRLKRRKIKQKT